MLEYDSCLLKVSNLGIIVEFDSLALKVFVHSELRTVVLRAH